MTNRAAKRRAAKAWRKQAKTTPEMRQSIIDAHWRDGWHFTDAGLTVLCKFTGRFIAHYPGV